MLFNLFDSPVLQLSQQPAKWSLTTRKFFWFTIIFQNVSAYCVTLMFYQIVGLCIGEVAFNFWTVVAFVLLAGVLYLLFRKDPNKQQQRALHLRHQTCNGFLNENNLEFNTADLIAVIVLLCLLGLAVKIIIGFFKEKEIMQ